MSKNDEHFITSPPVWRPDQPYNELPLLPPEGVELETREVLRQCIAASAAVAGLSEASRLLHQQDVLIHWLPAFEAKASSEIENIVTTTDELFKNQEIKEQMDPATKEALRYRKALLEGCETLAGRPLTTGTAEAICSIIKGREMRVRQVPGTQLANDRTGEVIYTPPVGEDHLRSLLANWERFIHDQVAIQPLVRMAVMHYQFEVIHPFTDGNGRTGRVLNSLFLIEQGLLDLPILYLSRYIIRNKDEYYRLLRGVTREGAWEPWIIYILRGVEETATWTRGKIHAINTLFEATTKHCRAQLPKKTYSKELVEVLFKRPYCRIGDLVQADVAKRQTASEYLKELVAIGVLEERVEGREKLYLNTKFWKLLTQEGHGFDPYPDAA